MPAIITHYLIGEDVIGKCGLDFDTDEKAAFDLGLQGGDIFFYYAAFGGCPMLKKLGGALHRQYINGPVYFMNQYSETLENEGSRKIIRAYIMGYICHHAADSTAHPYINSLSQRLWEENGKKYDCFFYHARAEANIDVLMLGLLRNKTVKEYKPYWLFPVNERITAVLGKMYAYATEKAQYTDAPYKEYQKAFYSMKKGMRALYGPMGVKKRALFSLFRALRVTPFSQMIHPLCCDNFCDYLNLSHTKFCFENGEASEKSFPEIYKSAAEKAAENVLRWLRGENICGILEGRSFESGITVDENKYI